MTPKEPTPDLAAFIEAQTTNSSRSFNQRLREAERQQDTARGAFRNRHKGPSIIAFEDKVERSFGRAAG